VVYETSSQPLQTGDTLLFYTDGLVEAFGRDGRMVGYEALIGQLPHLTNANPEIAEQLLRQWHRGLVLPGPQDDDISIVVATFR
jgi:serine phosphatase RsbU (regulator of sigma subunit)